MPVRFKRSAEHELGDQHDVLLLVERRLPVVVEPHDVGMLQLLQHLGFLPKPQPLHFVQLLLLQLAPSHRHAGLRVQAAVDGFKRTSSDLDAEKRLP